MRISGNLGVGLAAAALIAVAGVAAPAQAATGWDRCPEAHFCAFAGPNGSGLMAAYQVGDPNLADEYGPTGMNDNIESVWNRTGSLWGVWRTIGGQNGLAIAEHFKYNMHSEFVNNISVIKRF
ncbi:peptidase inhibitor family I36 protein [Paenarthrobacter sp. NEAU-H11]|jgi:hypothetical protein|uniref:peptidase inhibitor family I36 protein n=1 Tax=Paenarthrobacter sp. NEAU-H11 TaxID=3423924 RepID=UPI003D33A93B